MNQDEIIKDLKQRLYESNKRVDEYVSLLNSLELINSSLNINEVLDYLMELAKKITSSEATSAILLENEKLIFVAASGLKSAEVKKVYLDKGEGIAGWVIDHNDYLFIDDVKKDKRFTVKVDRFSGFETKSIIAVPMKIEDEIIGVIEAVNKINDRQFNDSDIRLLSMLANSAAVAIQKARLYSDLNDLFISTVIAITNAIEAKDTYVFGHSDRIHSYCLVMANELDLPAEQIKNLEMASLLHDVGKIGVSERILQKQEPLKIEEFYEIHRHPAIGVDILKSIKQLKDAIPGIFYHHERYDGKGYPEGISEKNIPLIARIIAVADAFDAMTSMRPYRDIISDENAIVELQICSGKQFDPDCVNAFIRGYKKGLIKSFYSKEKEKK